jgi:hypothetical protein
LFDIGVLYTFSVSAAILFLDRSPHVLEEFRRIADVFQGENRDRSFY